MPSNRPRSTPDRSNPDRSKATSSTSSGDRREKARLAREQARRRDRRRKVAVVAGSAVAALVLVVGIGVVVDRARTPDADPLAVPANVVDDGIPVGQATAPVTVTVFLDYQCPVCARFEEENASYLAGLVDSGQAQVVYRPISILDRASGGTRYSTRAAGAAGCVAEADPDAVAAFTRDVFAAQPAEGGTGLDDARLVELATGAGAPDSVAACVDAGTYTGWAATVTDAARAEGVSATPTVLVGATGTDGQVVQDWSKPSLQAAVEAAATA